MGSPISPSSLTVASLHKRAVRISFSCIGSEMSVSFASTTLPFTNSFFTVMRFCVRVPVLSEQITDTLPRPSTACNFRIMAFSLAIFEIPKESTMVTMELKASGIAATARATANKKASIKLSCLKNTLMLNNMPQKIKIAMESFFPKLSRLTCKGVFLSRVFLRRLAILPISVSIPVDVTRKCPRP